MKKFALLIMLFLTAQISKSQDLGSILLAATSDANKLTEAYTEPAMKGLIYGMNNGWYHTAKVHKKFGFDITIGANASVVPGKDEFINFANLGLTNISSSSLTSPTLAGSGDGATMTVSATLDVPPFGTQDVSATFDMPSGVSEDLPLTAIPTPAVQVGFGLPHKFEIMLRAVPKVETDDVEASLFGIGLKKELTSLLGPLDKLPLHVSVLAAYTTMNVDYAMDIEDISGEDQNAAFKLNAFTVQAIGSLNFPIINIYGGIGYNRGTSNLNMNGTYDLDYTIEGGTFDGQTATVTVEDPLDLEYKAGSVNATLGARLSLGFFKIFGSYTIQEYNTISGGIAFSFR